MPHIIKVTGFNFTPIHTFAPQKQNNSYDGFKSLVSTFGSQRYIALAAGTPENKNANNYEPEGGNYTVLSSKK